MTDDYHDIIATTIRLAEARTAQAQAETELYRAKLGMDAPGAADPKASTSWAAPLFRRRTRRLDVTDLAHDLRDDGPKPRPPKRPEPTAQQKLTNQIRQTGQLFPQVPGATLTTNNNDRNN